MLIRLLVLMRFCFIAPVSYGAHSRCSASSPALADTPERWLYFHKTTNSSNTCAKSELAAPSCSAIPAEDKFKLRRLCPCKTSRRRLTFRPPHSLPRASGEESGDDADCPRYRPRADHRRLGSLPGTTNSALPSHVGVAPLATSLALSTLVSLNGGGRLSTTLLPLAVIAAAYLPRASAHNLCVNIVMHSQRAPELLYC